MLPVHIFFAALALFLIRLIGDSHAWLRASLTMAWGAIVLVDFLHLFFDPWPKLKTLGVRILWLSAAGLMVAFLVWLVVIITRAAVELIMPLFNSDFIIGPLYHGIHNFVFSLPAFVASCFLFFAASAWNDDEDYAWTLPADDPCVLDRKLGFLIN
jgi:hypothetical protein